MAGEAYGCWADELVTSVLLPMFSETLVIAPQLTDLLWFRDIVAVDEGGGIVLSCTKRLFTA